MRYLYNECRHLISTVWLVAWRSLLVGPWISLCMPGTLCCSISPELGWLSPRFQLWQQWWPPRCESYGQSSSCTRPLRVLVHPGPLRRSKLSSEGTYPGNEEWPRIVPSRCNVGQGGRRRAQLVTCPPQVYSHSIAKLIIFRTPQVYTNPAAQIRAPDGASFGNSSRNSSSSTG